MTGQTWAFSVQVKGGSMHYTYQWFEGNTPLLGQTSAQLTITKETAGTFSYYCQVADSGGTIAISNTVTLAVISLQQSPFPTPTTPAQSSYPTATPSSSSFSPTPKPLVSGINTEAFGVVAVAVFTIVMITGLLALELKRRRID
jgi:hypothetical protein